MMASEAKILQPIARVASVYRRIDYEQMMNWPYQTVKRSCYKPGKILSNARWERKSPEGRRFRKAKLSGRGRKCREENVIRPQSLPSAVFRNIG